MTPRAGLTRAWLALAVATFSSALLLTREVRTQPASLDDRAAAYEMLWMETTAALLPVAGAADPAAGPIGSFKAAQARLERAVIALGTSTPPAEAVAGHLLLVPAVQEVTSAARAVVEAVEQKDAPGVESAKAWFADSLATLSEALRGSRAAAR